MHTTYSVHAGILNPWRGRLPWLPAVFSFYNVLSLPLSRLNWRSLFPPWGSGPPPFPKMAPPFTGSVHTPLPGSGTIPLPIPIAIPPYTYTYSYTYTYVYLYLHEKEIIKLLVNFFELFVSFLCTRNRNRIPNTIPVPKSPNEYGSGSATLSIRRIQLCYCSAGFDISQDQVPQGLIPHRILFCGVWYAAGFCSAGYQTLSAN